MIRLNTGAIGRLEGSIEHAFTLTLEALLTDVISAQVMPYDNGDMQNRFTSTDVEKNGEELVGILSTDVAQARRLYYHPEYNFQKVNNQNAGAGWLEPWISGNRKDFVLDTFSKVLNKELK